MSAVYGTNPDGTEYEVQPGADGVYSEQLQPLSPDVLQDPTFAPNVPQFAPNVPIEVAGERAFGPAGQSLNPPQAAPSVPPAVAPEQAQQLPPPVPAGPGGVTSTQTTRTVLSDESKAALKQGAALDKQQAAQAATAAGAATGLKTQEAQRDADLNNLDAKSSNEQAAIEDAANLKAQAAQARFAQANDEAQKRIEQGLKRVESAESELQKDY